MEITVCAPTGRAVACSKINGYRPQLVASYVYLSGNSLIRSSKDLCDHRTIGYIPDINFDCELDNLNDSVLTVSRLHRIRFFVQLPQVTLGTGMRVALDFTLPFLSGLQKAHESRQFIRRSSILSAIEAINATNG